MNVNDIINAYQPTEVEFSFELDGGERFTFKAVTDYVELSAIKEKAAEFVRAMRAEGKCPPALAAFKDMPVPVLSSAFFLSSMCVSPTWSQADWLRLAKHSAWIFELLFNKMNQGQINVQVAREVAEVDRLGESSSSTPGDGTGSSLQETSTGATQTNSPPTGNDISSNSWP
jgi:hypothetical protein